MPDIRVVNIIKSFDYNGKAKDVLNGISLDINQGEFILITGQSGSGKTTFLMTLGGLITPDEGKIYFDKYNFYKSSEKIKNHVRAKFISYIFQNNILVENLSVLENILFPFQIKGTINKEILKKVSYLIDYFGIRDLTGKKISKLSGGEKQVVNFIRGVLPESPVLLADEPTSEVDQSLNVKILEYLKKLHQEKNVTIIMVSHDPLAHKYVRGIYKMQNGKFTDYVNQGYC